MTTLVQRIRHGIGWRLRRLLLNFFHPKSKTYNFLMRYFGTPEEKRISWSRYISRIAKKQNLFVYGHHLFWLNDRAFGKLRKLDIPGIPDDRLFFLYAAAKAAARLDGSIAECGVRAGKSSYAILKGFEDGPRKPMHLFDSFEGISEPAPEDLGRNGKTPWKRGSLAYSEEHVMENLAPFRSMIIIHRGWIPDKFHEIEKESFCFVHIDVDLFQPTRDSIIFFYDKLIKNGVLICDDYGSSSCPGAKLAFDDFFADKPEHVIALPTGQCLVVKT